MFLNLTVGQNLVMEDFVKKGEPAVIKFLIRFCQGVWATDDCISQGWVGAAQVSYSQPGSTNMKQKVGNWK